MIYHKHRVERLRFLYSTRSELHNQDKAVCG